MSASTSVGVPAPPGSGGVRPGPLGVLGGPAWPLVVLFAAYPLWWIAGVASFLPLLVAVPMALQLAARRVVLTPPRFGWWLLFLVWVAVGVLVLGADAPTAVEGGNGPGRLVVFLYRLCWYLACTVVLLWVGNLDRKDLPDRRVVRLLGGMFVVTTLGGLLGVVAPSFQMSSLLEMFLPASVARNDFVGSLVHVQAASIQNVLGEDAGRPIAPFAFANSWGSNLALFLPFFVLGWFGKDAGWRRVAGPFVLLAAAVPTVYSLNRGLWVCLALGVVLLLLRSRARRGVIVLAAAGTVVGLLVLLVASPLGTIVEERLANPHSNERRGQLLVETVRSTVTGSPVVGFGSTRDVQGSFFSIAGGSRPGCDACGVPPLGTQGQLWLVIFSQGLIGLVLFLGFFLVQLRRRWSGRTSLHLAGLVALVFFLAQQPVYDTLDLPMFTVMIAVALMWRADRLAADPPPVEAP